MYLQKALTIMSDSDLSQSKNSSGGWGGGGCTWENGSLLLQSTPYTDHTQNIKTVQRISQCIRVWKYPWPMDFRNILSWFKHNCSITKEEELTCSTRRKARHQYILQVNAGVIHENHHSAASLTSSPSIKHKEHTSPSYKFINRRGRG